MAFRDDPEHHRSVATLATRLCGKVFGFVKRKVSGAKRRMDAASGERGAGKGAAALVPASAHRNSDREAIRTGFTKIRQHNHCPGPRTHKARIPEEG
jgi:hypothetical protein